MTTNGCPFRDGGVKETRYLSQAGGSVAIRRPQYGRKLDDFSAGDVYDHPWSVTVGDGMLALWHSAFLDANALCTSDEWARTIGFERRVVPPSLVLNLGLSFSVHDVSQQAIAHLAYIDVRYPKPLYPGDTFRARSRVLGVRPSKSSPDKGTVHVHTVGLNQHGEVVLSFERMALIRGGRLESRPQTEITAVSDDEWSHYRDLPRVPNNVANVGGSAAGPGQPFFFGDFDEGDIILHDSGRTVGDSEHMMLTMMVRNTHPLHFDAGYCEEHSFTKNRVVYGGLVLSWTLAAASWDTSGNALWEAGLDAGAHPAPVHAGDTIYAASKVLETSAVGEHSGRVRFRTVGLKNEHASTLTGDPAACEALFTGERDKKNTDIPRVPAKVVEITRDVLIRRRPS
jgi:2-methylfumaryl-CoA hydratase